MTLECLCHRCFNGDMVIRRWFKGWRNGKRVYGVWAWRIPNEDGAARPIWRTAETDAGALIYYGSIQDIDFAYGLGVDARRRSDAGERMFR